MDLEPSICREVSDRGFELLEDETKLSMSASLISLREHIEDCDRCQRELNGFRTISSAARAAFQSFPPELSPEGLRDLLAANRQQFLDFVRREQKVSDTNLVFDERLVRDASALLCKLQPADRLDRLRQAVARLVSRFLPSETGLFGFRWETALREVAGGGSGSFGFWPTGPAVGFRGGEETQDTTGTSVLDDLIAMALQAYRSPDTLIDSVSDLSPDWQTRLLEELTVPDDV